MPPENNQNPIDPGQLSFEESPFRIRSRTVLSAVQVPAIIHFLIMIKIVKTEKQAIVLLLSMAGVFIAAAIFIISRSVTVPTAQINPRLISN